MRTRFLLARDEARLHIVEGLLKAIDIIDKIIALIRASASTEEAKQGLIGAGFSSVDPGHPRMRPTSPERSGARQAAGRTRRAGRSHHRLPRHPRP